MSEPRWTPGSLAEEVTLYLLPSSARAQQADAVERLTRTSRALQDFLEDWDGVQCLASAYIFGEHLAAVEAAERWER